MRKLILVSATSFEIEPTLQFLSGYRLNGQVYQLGNLQIQVCITGVGMINTAFELGRFCAQQFDLALNAGLAGCFGNRPKGSVLNIVSDCFSELGAQDDERFLTIDELGFGQQQQVPEKPLSLNFLSQLPSAHGVTVNTVHGHEASITALQSRLSPDTESMEGAAFFMAANRFGWTCRSRRMGQRIGSGGPKGRVASDAVGPRIASRRMGPRVASDGPAGRVGCIPRDRRGWHRMGLRVTGGIEWARGPGRMIQQVASDGPASRV